MIFLVYGCSSSAKSDAVCALFCFLLSEMRMMRREGRRKPEGRWHDLYCVTWLSVLDFKLLLVGMNHHRAGNHFTLIVKGHQWLHDFLLFTMTMFLFYIHVNNTNDLNEPSPIQQKEVHLRKLSLHATCFYSINSQAFSGDTPVFTPQLENTSIHFTVSVTAALWVECDR